MARSEEEFARLLTTGVYAIRACEPGKSISIIQDELGYAIGRDGGSAIEHWRKGHIPAEESDVERLAREIVRRSDLGKEWLESFLDGAGFPEQRDFCDELFPSPLPRQIPGQSYRKLVGRDGIMDDIIDALNDPDGKWIVTIDGMGGIGKTALAREVGVRCLREHHFNAVVWASASRRESASENYRVSSTLTFETVLDAIAHQLVAPDISKFNAKEKENRVHQLLRRQRVLIVLDNLETAEDPQHEIADRLRPLLDPSKCLLISRQRFKGDVYRVHLDGLDIHYALQLIRQDADEKNIAAVQLAKPDELDKIATSTGGCPLAIKLVVGQLDHLPMDAVLQHLREVRPLESKAEEDDHINLYRSIYLPSWELLSGVAKRLLISMTFFIPGWGGTQEAIKATSDLTDHAMTRGVHELWNLSLLEVGEQKVFGLTQECYYLHPLTQYFVLSDIVPVPNLKEREKLFQRSALRFVDYYIRYWENHREDHLALLVEAVNMHTALQTAYRWGIGKALVQGAIAFSDFLSWWAQYDEADQYLSWAEQSARSLDDDAALATVLHLLGVTAYERGQPDRADKCLKESLAIAHEIGDRERILAVLPDLVAVKAFEEDLDQVEKYAREYLVLACELEAREDTVDALRIMGELEYRRWHLDQADGHYQASLAIAHEIGNPERTLAVVYDLIQLKACREADFDQAERYTHEYLVLACKLRSFQDTVRAITALASLLEPCVFPTLV